MGRIERPEKKSVERGKRGLEQREQRQSTSYKFPRKIPHYTVFLKRGASKQENTYILYFARVISVRTWSIERRPMERFKRPGLVVLLFRTTINLYWRNSLFPFPAVLFFPPCVKICVKPLSLCTYRVRDLVIETSTFLITIYLSRSSRG